MRVAIVAEYYPRARDAVLGVWAHRQALAVRALGVEVEVFVLHRPIPPRAALRKLDLRAITAPLRQPGRAELDGIPISYVPFLSPPRPRSYGSWGAWAAPSLKRALGQAGGFDLIHAHYAAPAGDAVRRTHPTVPIVVSVHGGDVIGLTRDFGERGVRAVHDGLRGARLVLANSAGTAERARSLGARVVRVVHLGADVPEQPAPAPARPTVATVAHLVARKRHEDVARALTNLPGVRWEVVGDGPERLRLEALARELGLDARFHGALAHDAAVAVARSASAYVLPSVDEAFGVAYIEAMAAGVPAIGCAGEHGPEEIAAAGGGIVLVAPRDPGALAQAIRRVLADPEQLRPAARATVEAAFTWERCGAATLAAYEAAAEAKPVTSPQGEAE